MFRLAFWIHQMITLNIEARRSDHWQMFAHHVITLGLMGFSYLCNVTAIG
jgi:acyl-CoA-dependent ceramide synthase